MKMNRLLKDVQRVRIGSHLTVPVLSMIGQTSLVAVYQNKILSNIGIYFKTTEHYFELQLV